MENWCGAQASLSFQWYHSVICLMEGILEAPHQFTSLWDYSLWLRWKWPDSEHLPHRPLKCPPRIMVHYPNAYTRVSWENVCSFLHYIPSMLTLTKKLHGNTQKTQQRPNETISLWMKSFCWRGNAVTMKSIGPGFIIAHSALFRFAKPPMAPFTNMV